MEIYRCEKCGSFLASFDENIMSLKAKKGATIENNKLILKCKCGYDTEILRKEKIFKSKK